MRERLVAMPFNQILGNRFEIEVNRSQSPKVGKCDSVIATLWWRLCICQMLLAETRAYARPEEGLNKPDMVCERGDNLDVIRHSTGVPALSGMHALMVNRD
ncbi:hypothetical protein J6590_008612 [Homalodisca vitripennis]|nr:hypothetical protein J6590_008612 [Homalodisca vitripennis]